jgi:hypothetical protein
MSKISLSVFCKILHVITDNSSQYIEPYFIHKNNISLGHWLDYLEPTHHAYQIFSAYCQIGIDIIWYKYLPIKKVSTVNISTQLK